MRKAALGMLGLFIVCILCACSKSGNTDYKSWFPDNYSPASEQAIQGKDYQMRQETATNNEGITSAHSPESLVDLLLSNQSIELAEALWESQIANGAYSVTTEELNRNMLTYYVSSSEGDDANLGLSPKEPKKTLEQFSGKADITVLLKCGDVFEMTDKFMAGNNSIYSTYGQGSRPVVSYYRRLEAEFTRMQDFPNIWVADLQNMAGVYNGREDKDNCNIGQLVIDGVVNWKRVVVSTAAYATFNFPEDLENKSDNSWAVDWIESKLYLYSKKDPNKMEIYVAPDVHGVEVDGKKNVTIKGWTITGAGAHGCNMKNASNVTLQSCFFYNIGGSVHRAAGIRYGNAVQVWNSGKNILISGNYADWVFDSCYTNQGSDENCYCENVIFEKNIGAHSFTGIETWADSYSTIPFKNLIYRNNIVYGMCDITDADHDLFADKKGGLLVDEESEKEYISYRGGYIYHQMTCMNVTCSAEWDGLILEGNVCWQPKRLLLLSGSLQYPQMNNNTFYAEVPSSAAYMFRYKDFEGKATYSRFLYTSSNRVRVFVGKGEAYGDDSRKYLIEAMGTVMK